jgi:ribosomal-protein-alanine N-acetyltransferase
VRIAPLSAADEREFLALARDSREYHRPWVHPPRDSAGYAQLLARSAGEDTAALVARRGSDDALVGVFVLSQIFRRSFQNAYIGYYGSAAHAGHGYMTEALALVLDHAFGPLRLHRVEANVQPGNGASLALVQRCGFRREGFSPRYLKIGGRWRDHERWAIVAEDWRGLRRRARSSGRTGSAAP